MNRASSGVTTRISPTYGNMGEPAASTAQQRGSYDPLTGVFALGRQIGIARACQGSVLIFDGRQHYRLAVAPRSQGTFNGGGYNGPALSCQFRYEPIAGFGSDFDRSDIPGRRRLVRAACGAGICGAAAVDGVDAAGRRAARPARLRTRILVDEVGHTHQFAERQNDVIKT